MKLRIIALIAAAGALSLPAHIEAKSIEVRKAIALKADSKPRPLYVRITEFDRTENTVKKVTKTIKVKKKVKGKTVTVKKKKTILVDKDPWTKRRLSFAGPTLCPATATTVGTVAVDPKVIPFGSGVMVLTCQGSRLIYIAADTGTDVVLRRASHGREPVIDIYVKGAITPEYGTIYVLPYREAIPFRKLTKEEQQKRMNFALLRKAFGKVAVQRIAAK